MNVHHVGLTSAEIGSLWTGYMNDSMSKCMLLYMLKHIEDNEIHAVVEHALQLSVSHMKKITNFIEQENIPIPIGFTEDKDVNVNAPKLYTDIFCLTYLNHMSKTGLVSYSAFLAMSAREDIVEYFSTSLAETSKLFARTTAIALEKGVFVRAPFIPSPTNKDFVNSKAYLSGFHLFNKQRPLNTIEISHLHMNIQTNTIGVKLCMSFAQTTSSKEIQQFMLRGKEISQKHVKIFSNTLLENDIQAPASADVCITNSTTPPFSDKLTMFLMSLLSAAGTGNYATAAAGSQRSDIALNYERLSIEIAKYAKSGADIMIKNGWLEQPPGTTDKESLAKNNLH